MISRAHLESTTRSWRYESSAASIGIGRFYNRSPRSRTDARAIGELD